MYEELNSYRKKKNDHYKMTESLQSCNDLYIKYIVRYLTKKKRKTKKIDQKLNFVLTMLKITAKI